MNQARKARDTVRLSPAQGTVIRIRLNRNLRSKLFLAKCQFG